MHLGPHIMHLGAHIMHLGIHIMYLGAHIMHSTILAAAAASLSCTDCRHGHAGAGIALYAEKGVGESYQPHITSYDYDCMVSEAGQYGQPGIGGPNKYQVRTVA